MKKVLLLGCALMASASAFAYGTDGCTYEPTEDGITLDCLWAVAPDINKAEYDAMFATNGMTGSYARRCAVYDGKIYLPVGAKVTVGEGDDAQVSYPWKLITFDMYTGEKLAESPITLDGEPFNALLGAMNMGFDNYGHAWVFGYWGGTEANLKLPVYQIDVTTGALTALPVINFPVDDIAAAGRVDFPDFTGDITGEEDDAYFIAIPQGNARCGFNAFRFVLPQGSDEWEGGMDGFASWLGDEVVAWPSNAASWGDGTTAIFASGCNDIFYANGRNTYPTLYSCADGMPEMLGSFEQAGEGCQPRKTGANGAWEFTLGGKMWLGYGDGQGAEGGKFIISRMGGDADGGTFEGMEHMWTVPGDDKTFCSVSNGGEGAIHPVLPWAVKDENGKEGVYITSFYGKSELAVYLVAEPGFNSGVGTIIVDKNENAPVEYFNIQGMRVNNPENGVYIMRQGNKVTKIVK